MKSIYDEVRKSVRSQFDFYKDNIPSLLMCQDEDYYDFLSDETERLVVDIAYQVLCDIWHDLPDSYKNDLEIQNS